MTLPQIKDHFFKELEHLYPETEIESFMQLILEHHFGIRRIDLALNPELKTRSWNAEPFKKAVRELLDEKPIQYIIGSAEFAGMSFSVNESVLIPRPETEELVKWVADSAKEIRSPEILDIGTGSGCIPIALAKCLPASKVQALDISKYALDTARKNAERLKADVMFFEQDILSQARLKETYDIIVSNPPYVRKSETSKMRKNVVRFEPELALFVSDHDPLEFFRRIGEHGLISLKPGGMLFFEINEFLGDKTVRLLSDQGYSDILLKKDIYDKDRMIRAVKK